MILEEMRPYGFYLYEGKDSYGQAQLSKEIKGTLKMSIATLTQAVADNVRYKDATYIGLTLAGIDESYVIQYGKEKLKVLYVQPRGRYKQVFLKRI